MQLSLGFQNVEMHSGHTTWCGFNRDNKWLFRSWVQSVVLFVFDHVSGHQILYFGNEQRIDIVEMASMLMYRLFRRLIRLSSPHVWHPLGKNGSRGFSSTLQQQAWRTRTPYKNVHYSYIWPEQKYRIFSKHCPTQEVQMTSMSHWQNCHSTLPHTKTYPFWDISSDRQCNRMEKLWILM